MTQAPARFATTDKLTPLDLAWDAAMRDSHATFAEAMTKAMLFPDKTNLRAYALREALKAGIEGEYVEFGVARGKGINQFARILGKRGLSITGFDSFLGLSEDWTGHQNGRAAGSYTLGGEMPEVRGNVELRAGWIEDTLPGWLTETEGRAIPFAHMDFDTYTPTAFALRAIKGRLRPGSVLLFDELYGYPGWREHEYKALMEELAPDAY
ncbi:MAG: class I SAM-dependent methyltransferase, partial [Shimia sp.]